MKAFIGFFRMDLYRFIKKIYWLAGILGVTFFLFFSLETRGFINGNVVRTYLFSTAMSGHLAIYSFCAYSFAPVFGEDLEHRYIRSSIIRGDLRAYVLSKSLVIYLSSILVMLAGTLLFLFLCRTQVPWVDWNADSYGTETRSYGSLLEKDRPLAYCMLYALHMGLLAGMLSLFSAFCSVFITNRTLVLILPAFMMLLLALLPYGSHNIFIFYANGRHFPKDWQNLLFVFLLSAVPSALLGAGIYHGLKKKL